MLIIARTTGDILKTNEHYSNASDIATVFAKRFHQACLPNSLERNAELRLKFEAKLYSYSSNSDLQWISFDLVDKCVRGMKLGKAPGIDGIEAEHLRYAHPRIVLYSQYCLMPW